MICGDANPNGNIAMHFKGSCHKELDMADAYRCTGCGGYFHLDCIFEHFEQERGHDNARYSLAQITKLTKNPKIKALCAEGLKRNKPAKTLLFSQK